MTETRILNPEIGRYGMAQAANGAIGDKTIGVDSEVVDSAPIPGEMRGQTAEGPARISLLSKTRDGPEKVASAGIHTKGQPIVALV